MTGEILAMSTSIITAISNYSYGAHAIDWLLLLAAAAVWLAWLIEARHIDK